MKISKEDREYLKQRDILFRDIGRFVYEWTCLEQRINFLVNIFYTKLGGKNIHPKNPKNLSDQLKFMNKCQKNITSLKPYQNKITDLIRTTKSLKDSRHNIIHGFVGDIKSYNEKDGGTYHIQRLIHENGIVQYKEIKITNKSIVIASMQAYELVKKSTEILFDLDDDILKYTNRN